MSLIECAGSDVQHGRICFPARGAWFASLVVDTPTLPSGKTKITADGGFSLTGTVIPSSSGVFLDSAHVSILGGAGGLGKLMTPSAYENAQLRDPLNAIMRASGETLSSTVSSSITGAQLTKWTIVASTAARAIDELCGAASIALASPVTWRVLPDGTVWLGVESWPTAKLPDGADVLSQQPSSGLFIIGVQTPALLPGVNLSGVGKVAAVDHWIKPDSIRSWAWL